MRAKNRYGKNTLTDTPIRLTEKSYDYKRNSDEQHFDEIQSAGMRLLGKSVHGLRARLQILLCVLYEAVYKAHGGMGRIYGRKVLDAHKECGKYRGKEIFIGSVTDPYQPAEEKYLRTRTLLEELKGSGAIISISTKSDLIVRDLDLIKSFDNATVSWSVNTLDENFRRDMDRGVSIERRLAAMKVFHDAKVKTTCFISPIFPEITNVKEIIERARGDCNLIWLENLNLRGTFKPVITEYIAASRPQLIPLYRDIYTKGNDCYWQSLDGELQEWAKTKGLEYLTNEDVFDRPFDAPTVIVNFFYHSKIKKSAKNKPNITQ